MIEQQYAGTHLVSGTFGDQQGAFASALVGKDEGFTLDEAVLRITAVGGPFWNRAIRKSDMSFMVRTPSTPRSKRRGTVHAFANKAEKGAKESCMASNTDKHGDCKATAKSMGDSITRWRTDDDSNGKADTRVADMTGPQIVSAATSNLKDAVDFLKGKGHTLAEMKDTPGLSQRVNVLAAVTKKDPDEIWAGIFGEAKRATKSATAKKSTSTRVKKAPAKAAAK